MLSNLFLPPLAAAAVSAQLHTSCDPTKTACPDNAAFGGQRVAIDFAKGESDIIHELPGTTLQYDPQLGAVFTINKDTDAPTAASSKYIFFGEVAVVARAAPGVGVVSSIVLQSDDLDEIDWEWIGGDHQQVQTNYYSRGCVENYGRGRFHPVATPQDTFHTYTITWTRERLDWKIDGQVVRSLLAGDGKGCDGYPQTPMQIRIGTWVGGRPDAGQGTIDWAGGLTDFASAPFVGYYKSLSIVDYMGGEGAKSASKYLWSDRTGTMESIQVVGGSDSDSTASNTTNSSKSTGTPAMSSTATDLTTLAAASASPSGGLSNSSALSGSAAPTGISGASGSNGSGSSNAVSTPPSSAPPNSAGKVVLTLVDLGGMCAAVVLASLLL